MSRSGVSEPHVPILLGRFCATSDDLAGHVGTGPELVVVARGKKHGALDALDRYRRSLNMCGIVELSHVFGLV